MISKQQELGQDFFLKSMDVDFANMLYIRIGNHRCYFFLTYNSFLYIVNSSNSNHDLYACAESREKMRDNGKRRYAMGDKGKKDKDKGQKQKINKQEQKAKEKLAKQPRRTP